MTSYYELTEDVNITERWYLGELTDCNGTELDCRDFTYGRSLDLGPPLRLSLRHKDTIVNVSPPLLVEVQKIGPALDFTFNALDAIIVSSRVADILGQLCGAEIQRIPVTVGKRINEYEIINCTRSIECIDKRMSTIEWWTDKDHRPDKVGQPRMITNLVIDATRTQGSHFFRVKTWDVSIVVSDMVKRSLNEARIKGVAFRPCSL